MLSYGYEMHKIRVYYTVASMNFARSFKSSAIEDAPELLYLELDNKLDDLITGFESGIDCPVFYCR